MTAFIVKKATATALLYQIISVCAEKIDKAVETDYSASAFSCGPW